MTISKSSIIKNNLTMKNNLKVELTPQMRETVKQIVQVEKCNQILRVEISMLEKGLRALKGE